MELTTYDTTGRIEGANVVTLVPSAAGGDAMAMAIEFADGTGAWDDGLPMGYALQHARAVVSEHSLSQHVRDWAGWA